MDLWSVMWWLFLRVLLMVSSLTKQRQESDNFVL